MMPRPISQYKRRGIKLTQHQCYVFDKLKRGEKIMVSHLPDRTRGYTLTNGFELREDTFDRLLAAGFLEGAGDGLIEGMSQTWRLAPYAEAT